MKKIFDEIVDHAVANWRTKRLSMNNGLGGPSENFPRGVAAEEYIIGKIMKLPTGMYYARQSNTRSHSPADVCAIGRRHKFWHIMLIQVKSSTDKNSIASEIATYTEGLKGFALDVKELVKSTAQGNQPLVITYGYAGVYTNTNNNNSRHLQEALYLGNFRSNCGNVDWSGSAKALVQKAHGLRG